MAEPTPAGEIVDIKSAKMEKDAESKFHCDKCQSNGHKTEDHGKLGGARPGGGMRKGQKIARTLEQAKVKEVFNQMVMRGATKLFNAQFNLALGEQSLFVKYHVGEGKNQRTEVDVVTDVELIKEYLVDDGLSLNQDSDDEYYYLSTKPANNLAIQNLLDRALGKAPDKLELSGGFFSQSNLTIEVVGPRNDIIDINSDGTISGLGDGGDEAAAVDKSQTESEARHSDPTSEPPANS